MSLPTLGNWLNLSADATVESAPKTVLPEGVKKPTVEGDFGAVLSDIRTPTADGKEAQTQTDSSLARLKPEPGAARIDHASFDKWEFLPVAGKDLPPMPGLEAIAVSRTAARAFESPEAHDGLEPVRSFLLKLDPAALEELQRGFSQLEKGALLPVFETTVEASGRATFEDTSSSSITDPAPLSSFDQNLQQLMSLIRAVDKDAGIRQFYSATSSALTPISALTSTSAPTLTTFAVDMPAKTQTRTSMPAAEQSFAEKHKPVATILEQSPTVSPTVAKSPLGSMQLASEIVQQLKALFAQPTIGAQPQIADATTNGLKVPNSPGLARVAGVAEEADTNRSSIDAPVSKKPIASVTPANVAAELRILHSLQVGYAPQLREGVPAKLLEPVSDQGIKIRDLVVPSLAVKSMHSATKTAGSKVINSSPESFVIAATKSPESSTSLLPPTTSLGGAAVMGGQVSLTETTSVGGTASAMRGVDASALHDQVMRVITDRRVGQDNMTVKLNPASLGSLEIKFNKDAEGEVNITIMVRESPTKDLLEQFAPRVRQLLQESGVSVGAFDVHDESAWQNGENPFQQTPEKVEESGEISSSEQGQESLQATHSDGFYTTV